MSSQHWCLILSGKSDDDAAVHEAVEAVRARGVRIDLRLTEREGDAARHVADAIAQGAGTIIAAGGDGTLNAVAMALAQRAESADELPALAVLPLGTANDFAVASGLPEEPLPALELVATQPARAVDLLRVQADGQERWVANLASAGFGTQATVDTPEGMKKLLGGLAYVITGLAKLGRVESTRARLHGPGFEWQGEFIALGIGNGRQAGGGQALCPDALLDDGLLDVSLIPGLEGELAATLGTVVSQGREAALERVAMRAQLPWVEVEAGQPLSFNLDGEPLEARRLRLDCVPGRLRMHLPADCALLGAPAQALRRDPQTGSSATDPRL